MKIITALTFQLLAMLPLQIITGQSQITLTSDQQLIDLLDPDKVLDLSRGYDKVYRSLRQ